MKKKTYNRENRSQALVFDKAKKIHKPSNKTDEGKQKPQKILGIKKRNTKQKFKR